MKTTLFAAALLALGLTGSAIAADAATQPASANPSTQPAMTQYQTASYGIGYYMMGRQIKESGLAFDVEELIKGIRDSTAGTASKITPEQFQSVMAKVEQDMAAHQQTAAKAAGDENAKAGDAYRAENGKKAGVKTTASGLQIETVKEGTGASPTAADTVKVHYTGKFIDGKTFDSSVDRGQPISFPLNGVIAGWTEGLQLMKVGGKARLVIPPEIGYGPQGSPGSIPPNATLVFDVELIDVTKK